jgi:hypothetical protein
MAFRPGDRAIGLYRLADAGEDDLVGQAGTQRIDLAARVSADAPAAAGAPATATVGLQRVVDGVRMATSAW